jgi:hypothetical protein
MPIGSLPVNHFFEVDMLIVVEVGGPTSHPNVEIKSIDLETGETLWNASAARLRGVTEAEYDHAVIELAHRALHNGLNKPAAGSQAAAAH